MQQIATLFHQTSNTMKYILISVRTFPM